MRDKIRWRATRSRRLVPGKRFWIARHGGQRLGMGRRLLQCQLRRRANRRQRTGFFELSLSGRPRRHLDRSYKIRVAPLRDSRLAATRLPLLRLSRGAHTCSLTVQLLSEYYRSGALVVALWKGILDVEKG